MGETLREEAEREPREEMGETGPSYMGKRIEEEEMTSYMEDL